MSKVFDKVDHCALYIKLMKWNIPLEFLNVLINWYSSTVMLLLTGIVFFLQSI